MCSIPLNKLPEFAKAHDTENPSHDPLSNEPCEDSDNSVSNQTRSSIDNPQPSTSKVFEAYASSDDSDSSSSDDSLDNQKGKTKGGLDPKVFSDREVINLQPLFLMNSKHLTKTNLNHLNPTLKKSLFKVRLIHLVTKPLMDGYHLKMINL